MADILTMDDLPDSVANNELADLMLAGANAYAARVAPCLISDDPAPSPHQLAEAKLILVGALQRWEQAGTGAFQQQTAGPFAVGIDTRQRAGFGMWPSEITALQAICPAAPGGRLAFSVDTAPSGAAVVHADVCDLFFGGPDCSCGALLAGHPLYEVG